MRRPESPRWGDAAAARPTYGRRIGREGDATGEKLDALFVVAASSVRVDAVARDDQAVKAAGKVAETAARVG